MSLCALIVLTAFLEYPDMPRTMFGLPGLNPWNILFLSTFLAWLCDQSKNVGQPMIPKPYKQLIVLQIVIFVVAFVRIYFDAEGLERLAELRSIGKGDSPAGMVNAYLVNTLKWLLPFFMMYHGATTRNRKLAGLFAILVFYLALALLILKVKSLGSIVDVDSLTKGSIKIDRFTGYHRVDASAILAGGSWIALALLPTQKAGWRRAGLFGVFLAIVLGMVVTGGRAGYLAWAAIGCLLAALRWRKALVLVPLVAMILFTAVPAIQDRLLVGFADDDNEEMSVSKMTADRDTIWRLTLAEIKEQPFFGYGRLALFRTGVAQDAYEIKGEYFGHPHNAYLEFMLDNGLVGLVPVLLYYFFLVKACSGLLRKGSDPLEVAVAGACFSVVMAQLITSLTAQTFYPRNGTMAMWCVMGLFLRVLADKSGSVVKAQSEPVAHMNGGT